MIEICGLSKRYPVDTGSVAALEDVDLQLDAKDCLGLFGPSGSGKSTLLRCIAGLEAPETGVIRICGVEVYNAATKINLAPWMRPIGFVFQDYALWPHLTVIDNVLFPLRHGRKNLLGNEEKMEQALDVLQRVRMGSFASRFPSELSGGQRQRVALARALVSRPNVLLMDEPLSSLDPQLRRQTRNELVEILGRCAITTIFVSHDHDDGVFMANRVGIMREGRLVQEGRPSQVFTNPLNASVAETLDMGAVFACRRELLDAGIVRHILIDPNQSIDLPASRADVQRISGDTCFLLVRGDACSLPADSAQCVQGQKLVGRVLGDGHTARGWCVLVSIAGVTIELWQRERHEVTSGQSIVLTLDVRHVQVIPT